RGVPGLERQHRAVGGPLLDVGADRHGDGWRTTPAAEGAPLVPLAPELGHRRGPGRADLVVEPVVLAARVQLVRGDAEDGQADRRQEDEGDDESGPEGHPPMIAGSRVRVANSSRSRSTNCTNQRDPKAAIDADST